ncbi:MAG: hypothetical protein J6A62_01470 [Oscillospiraceae bacterium]|nr:hypothetical protein [Oscillospiraceae bacterium]
MADYAVLEQGDALRRRLEAQFGEAADPDSTPRLLVVAPGWEQPCGLQCETVLLPGSAAQLLDNIQARRAVSYGMCGRDTITLSSRTGQRLCVAIQRELVRLDGTVAERQEVVLRVKPGTGNMEALALVGAMLLIGTVPGQV